MLLERASHYAYHHLAGQGCGGCILVCPPHYHPHTNDHWYKSVLSCFFLSFSTNGFSKP
jgi:hypothetical protein